MWVSRPWWKGQGARTHEGPTEGQIGEGGGGEGATAIAQTWLLGVMDGLWSPPAADVCLCPFA